MTSFNNAKFARKRVSHNCIKFYENDLPDEFVSTSNIVAVDTEAMGLIHGRDRLCLVQLSFDDGIYHVIHMKERTCSATNLKRVLENNDILKIFHFARFDMGILMKELSIKCGSNIYCTKIASKIARTFTDRHGLAELCRQLLGYDLSKSEQTSYWGADTLTEAQKEYAIGDVMHLHAIKAKLDDMLKRENRAEIARKCFIALSVIVDLDANGWNETVFSH